MSTSPHISIVSPVYRAEEILETLVSELHLTLQKIGTSYEIILVDDRSPDNSWEIMKRIASENEQVKSIRLSRNFGQHATIIAGLEQAKGEWIVVMDCDMQDQPKEIMQLYKKTMEGFEVVLARREKRMDGFFKKLSSKLFYKTFNYLADIEINHEIGNFGIYHKKVIHSILKINDTIKFFPLFIHWVGFKTTSITIEHNSRLEGKSSYSFKKLITLALDVILSFSNKPLKIFVFFGLSISVISFFVGMFFLIQALNGTITEPGFSSLILSIWFLSGVIIASIGIVGLYIGKTFNQTKNRPVYIIDQVYEK